MENINWLGYSVKGYPDFRIDLFNDHVRFVLSREITKAITIHGHKGLLTGYSFGITDQGGEND
jgi:hypothetical protein